VCQAATGGFTAPALAEVNASCAGTKCRTTTDGVAHAPGNQAKSRTACTAGRNGQCASSSRVGATVEGAQVSATCQATKGSTCRHAYSARSSAAASAPGAQARAKASCGAKGGSGRGWCATSAQAQAGALPDGASAYAAASCQGSKGSGCRRSSYAHAEASDSRSTPATYESWGGVWNAHGEGTCTTSGGAGAGGCGVEAHAAAGPGGYGFARCTGDCRRFVDASTGNHFTPTTPPIPRPVRVIVTKGGGNKDGADQRLGNKENEIGIGCGMMLGGVKCIGYNEEKADITDCTKGCKITGSKGEQVKRSAGASKATGTTPNKDRVEGSRSVQIVRYQYGYGGGYSGRGFARDGRTGSKFTTEGGFSTAKFSNSRGAPFRGKCVGNCGGPGSGGVLKGAANAKVVDHFSLDRGSFDFTARNAAGLGGHISIGRSGGTTGKGVIATGGLVALVCDGCDSATHRMPTRAGRGGVSTCQVSAAGSSCTGTGAPRNGGYDVQRITAGKNGAAEFVQFHRNADGSGGGAVAFTRGTGFAGGRTAPRDDGHVSWIRTRAKNGTGVAGMGLLYDEGDGYNHGQACTGECQG
jgi:hypothetical protein